MTGRSATDGPRTHRTHLARRVVAMLGSAAAMTGLALGMAAPASAAGPVLVSSGDLDISAQRAVVSWVDGQQRMLIELDLEGNADPGASAVLLLATPTPPQVTVADPAVMQSFVDAGSPELIEEEHWWPDLQSFGGGGDRPAWLRPEVALAEISLSTHAPASGAQIAGFYAGQGFPVGEETTLALQTYTAGGWAITEVRIDPGEESTDVRSTPVLDLSFASPDAVVPMLLYAGGALPLDLSTYVLGTERLDRTSMPSSASVRYSGPITSGTDPLLTDWLAPYGGTAVMTVVDQPTIQTSQMTEDIRFGPSIYGPISAGTEVVRVERIIFGIPAGLVLVAGGMVLVAVLGVIASRLMNRGYED
ncbi:DUF2330 domain-containing protein [Serinibacter arcticus]|nr:DUF2330 domain-containing protein [Serinibacter arcticus]